jgi:uncharacterized protein
MAMAAVGHARIFVAMLAALGALGAPVAPADTREDDSATAVSSRHLGAAEVERLLAEPACLGASAGQDRWDRVQDFPVSSNGITLSAQLYLPEGTGPWPAVILVPGGFNETDLIMLGPRHDAPRLARCGFAAVVYYKRGTGPSGGSFVDANYDDFIDDVGSIARQLARHPQIDRARVGVKGGSSGGLIGSIAAARYAEISFVVNTSGPIVPMNVEGDFNIAYALRSRGNADSLIEQVMPLWRRHHAAWTRADTTALEALAAEIKAARARFDPALLPTPYDEVFADSSLAFFWPTLRSASRDYLAELKTMRKPWLSIYGEDDPIVPVAACVRSIDALMQASGNEEHAVIVLPGVDHSFFKTGTRDPVPVLNIVVNWLAENVRRK